MVRSTDRCYYSSVPRSNGPQPRAASVDGNRSSSASDDDQAAEGVRSVSRALGILALLDDRPDGLSLHEIVESTGLAKTTVLRLVQTLRQSGLLWVDSRRRYVPGPGLLRWSHIATRGWELPAPAREVMRALADRCGETAILYVRHELRRVCVAYEEGTRRLRHIIELGDEYPLWGGAASKVLLLDAPPELLTRVALASPHGLDELARLRAQVRETELAGYAESSSELEAGLSSVAVPVRNAAGHVLASLSLGGPSSRFGTDEIAEMVVALQAVAADLAGFLPFGAWNA